MPDRFSLEEKTRVWQVIVSIGEERREYHDCWIVIDHQDHVVHIWTSDESRMPALTAPFVATLIEWKKP